MHNIRDKKVAIVVCAWPPSGGGIGNNASYHLHYLKQLGYKAQSVTPQYKNISIISDPAIEYLPVTLPIGKAGFIFSLYKKLKDFDIIHLYYPFFGTDIIILFFKLLNRNKKIIVHYQMDPVGRGYQKIIFKIHIKIFLPLIVKVSNKIFVLSWDNARHTYLNTYLNTYNKKFIEIPNGIDTSIFKIKTKNIDLAGQYNITSKNKLLIFAGGLDDQHFFKGVDVLIRAFDKISKNNKEVKLMIIGDGNRKKFYERLVDDFGLGERVIFTGWIDNKKLADYYNLGSVFVLPSTERTESFGIVIAEAQACGLPAIVSNWPGSRLTIEDGKTGLLVEPKNENDLTNKIIRLLNDNDLRQAMSRKAIVRANEKYSWDSIIIKIDSVYKNL